MSETNQQEFSSFDSLQQLLIHEHGFRDMNHLAQYANTDENLKNLADLLKINLVELGALFSPFNTLESSMFCSEKAQQYTFGLSCQPNTKLSGQYVLDDWPSTISYPKEASVKKDALYFGHEDQKNLPICVSIALGITAQVAFNNEVKFSKKFYDKVVHHEMGTSQPGSCAHYALQAANKWGFCPDNLMPLEPWEESDNDHTILPTEFTIKVAQKYKLNKGHLCYDSSLAVSIIKSTISGHHGIPPRPAPIGIPLYSSFNNNYTSTYGEVNCPLPNEKIIGYHAMTAVGYSDDETYPGGGYVVVLNSWGESWASRCVEGAGLCRIPYRYLEEYNEEVSIMLLKSEQLSWDSNQIEYDESETFHHGYVQKTIANIPSLGVIQKSLIRDTLKNLDRKTSNSQVILGKNRFDEDIYWDSEALANQHILLVGSSGETKSNTLKHWIHQQKFNQSTDKSFIFDMHGEYPSYCTALHNGDYKAQCVNIAEIGFPFQVLKIDDGIPLDIQLERVLQSIKSSAPQMGNIQISLLREIIKQGLAEQWSNLELRKQLEKIEDHNTRSQIYPFILLLRSDGQTIDEYLQNNLTVFDLSAYQDPRSRAAFVIFTTAQLFHYQEQNFKHLGPENFNSIRLWIEEATTVKEAKQLFSVLFQESRKFKLFGAYITQVLSDIPVYINRNCATKVFFRSAAKDHHELKNKLLPEKIGEAIVQMDEQEYLIQIPLCNIDNLPQVNTKQYAAAANYPPNKVKDIVENSLGINIKKPKYAKQTISSTFSWFNKSKRFESNNSWRLCFKFSVDDQQIIMDAETGAIVSQLEPYSTMACWQHILTNLHYLVEPNELQKQPKVKALSLCETGLFGYTDNGLDIAPFLKNMPQLFLPEFTENIPNDAPTFHVKQLKPSLVREFRSVVSALWKITIPPVAEPIYIPINN